MSSEVATRVHPVVEAIRQARMTLRHRPRTLLVGGAVTLAIVAGLLYGPPVMAIRRSRGEWQHVIREVAETRQLGDAVRRDAIPPLPTVDVLPDTLAYLNAVTRSHEIQVVEVVPGAPQPADPQGLVVVPVELQVVGAYRALGEFLGALRQATTPGAVFVCRVSLESDEQLLPQVRARLSLELNFRQVDHGSS